MRESKRSLAGIALTELLPDLFRLNNRLLLAGDRLVAGLGLTSGRWRVLGAIIASERPQPIAWLSRDLGANRQNVQRIVNDLAKDGHLAFEPNPHHRGSQLVVLTDRGRQTFDAAMRLQTPWVNSLSDGLSTEDIETVHRVMTVLRKKLEASNDREGEPIQRVSRPKPPRKIRRLRTQDEDWRDDLD
jgi:DNA-binding MarR family transcriptional regulator